MSPRKTVRWSIADSWNAAAVACAAAYGVDRALIQAPSRGRGPRPPEEAREPKKMAIAITVMLAGCEYTQLADALGLHKDTVGSHCQAVREARAVSPAADRYVEALHMAAEVSLELSGAPSRGAALDRLRALALVLLRTIDAASEAQSDEQARFIRPSSDRRELSARVA